MPTRRTVWHLLVAIGTAVTMFAATGFAVVAGPALWAQWTGRTVTRPYRVYRPATLPPHPALVVDLHPSGVTGFWEEAVSGMHGHADQLGWIIAYPDSDDVASLGALIDHLTATDHVDPNRVYVMGLSRGGMLAYQAACELSARIAAIAVVEGYLADQCRPRQPVSVLAVHGTADSAVPINGGRFTPFTEVINHWRGLDRCAEHGSVTAASGSTDTTWQCGAGTQVRSIVVTGGHHTFPGAPLESLPWSASAALDTAAVIADFFAGHRRETR